MGERDLQRKSLGSGDFTVHYTATHAVTEGRQVDGPTTQRRTVTLQVSASSTLDSCKFDIPASRKFRSMESGHDGPGASTILLPLALRSPLRIKTATV